MGMKEYTYSVARVRAKEASLMTRQDIDQLLGADSYETALRVARDHGYAARESADAQEVAAAARRELWAFIDELEGAAELRALRIGIDYHNVKAAVKSVFSGVDGSDLLLENGTVDGEAILDAVKRREYGELDEKLAAVCEEALALLLRTQDGQACDICVDKAMLAAMDEAAAKSRDAFIRGYVERYIDIANLKAAYRCAIAERNLAFIENALYGGGSLNARELSLAAAKGLEALTELLASGRYGAGAQAMKVSAARFEKWCGDEMARYLEAARWDSFSVAPIVAYYCAKSAEIATVRLILSGKRNQLDDGRIRERVAGTYV